MAEQNNQAERAEFERQVLFLSIIDDEGLDQNEAGEYIDEPAQAAWLTWQAARRAALSAAVDAEGLPPLPTQHEELRARWKCEDCDGRGHDGEAHWQGHFQPPEPAPCSSCEGSGWIDCEALLPEQAIEFARTAIAADRRKQAVLTQMIELGQGIEASGRQMFNKWRASQPDPHNIPTWENLAASTQIHWNKQAIYGAAPSHQSPGKEGATDGN